MVKCIDIVAQCDKLDRRCRAFHAPPVNNTTAPSVSMLVDSHVHVALDTYEPVEILLAQMHHNGVEKALLVQPRFYSDNSYLVESMRRFPDRFSVLCWVDPERPDALTELEHWRHEGAESLRLTNFDRSAGDDPLAIWKEAEKLSMSVSVGGPTQNYSSPEFAHIVEQLPNLKFVFEHLAGMGLKARGSRAKATEAEYRQALKLASYPNTYIKIHGMGEICSPPFPFKDIPPYVKMAYDAFGPGRMMWGSNWPPVVKQEGYRNALRFTIDNLTFCSKDDIEWIFGKTALAIWKFA